MKKLTLNDAIRIRVQVRRGVSQADLAREYGVTRGNITAIVQRKTHQWTAIRTRSARQPKDSELTKLANWYRPEGERE